MHGDVFEVLHFFLLRPMGLNLKVVQYSWQYYALSNSRDFNLKSGRMECILGSIVSDRMFCVY